ncbi:THAP domain-containing protein 1-like [Pseudomyrmex gracilis]|uniref:THAP domain-containing protein 1-like n=1 Tax=Pseudomyrmex gracilis TaxID=219809 RepID=UPI0009958FE1|nr:THAP domain-containing protein 1-like [Pseudomyrmex gracilis]
MVVYCFIEGCKSTKYKSVKEKCKKVLTFFGFPTNSILREKWIQALINSGHKKEHVARITKCSRICSLHFAQDCIETIGFSSGRLKPNSVPTIFPNAPEESITDNENPGPSNKSSMEIETVAQCEDEICQTPPIKQIYYIVDVNSGNIKNMSSKMLVRTLNMLKKSCEKKDKIINRLRVQHFRQKRKIESLEALLAALRERNLLPPVSSDTVQV